MTDAPDILWRHVRTARQSAPGDQPVTLVVDPDPEARLQVQYALRHDGDVDVAGTAEDAVRMATETAYDAVLISLSLPDATGMTVLKRLRFRAAYRQIPMLAITNHSLPGDRERTERAGFDGFVAKPLRPEEVRARLTRLFSKRSAEAWPGNAPRVPRAS
ncbi:hypothetical protein CRI94_11520 [Longibacter salinarum]|uniref:Response regulatory domain-containing protein n=1 Tax=Longibacter salinarum TaxID=1850348 RepID=A0A2A8CX33_9BACT|nr:response regulator [Longibacter salinarum]PEN13262.1 hypothetical protein CRI94_11520 [Longibacter salinarum]